MCEIIQIPTAANFQLHWEDSRRAVVIRLRECIRLMEHTVDDELLSALVCSAETLVKLLGTVEDIGRLGRMKLIAHRIAP